MKSYAKHNKREKVSVAVLPTIPFYMITASFKAKICITFFTVNQSNKTNLRK